jgi:hypothetical protein
MKQKLDKVWVGILTGLIGAVAGFFLFGFFFALGSGTSMQYFINNIFLGGGPISYQDKVVSVSMVMDIVLFFVFMQMHWDKMSKGILAVVISAVPVVVYLY